jgi:mono/diheme cytochrome c family protein
MKKAVVLSIAMALTFATFAMPAMAASNGDAAAGKALFATKCAACHGPAGEGKDSIAKAMKVELRPFASKDVQAKTDAALKKDTTEGIGKMHAVKLTDDEVANVIAFMRTLAK